MAAISAKKLQFTSQGAFPSHIDPWAERGRYFRQLHAQMLGYLLDQIADNLYMRGYIVGIEESLQIPPNFLPSPKTKNYAQTVATLELETGIELPSPDVELDRLFIKALDTGALVTVIEFVSPNNKTRQKDILSYQSRREELVYQGVNIVEIDFTRSVKRLLEDPITERYPYHIAIYPSGESTYFIGMNLKDMPKTFALPLRNEAYPAELNSVYRQAYSKLRIATQIQNAGEYSLEALPFPSLLSENETKELLAALETWQTALKMTDSPNIS